MLLFMMIFSEMTRGFRTDARIGSKKLTPCR